MWKYDNVLSTYWSFLQARELYKEFLKSRKDFPLLMKKLVPWFEQNDGSLPIIIGCFEEYFVKYRDLI